MATTTVSQPSTTATTMVSQDNSQATTTVSHLSTMATTAVSLQTTATSAVSQSTMGHVTVSPSVGDISYPHSSISTAASELEAVIYQALPESIAATSQDPVTGNVPTQDPQSDLQGSANPATTVAQQLPATSPDNNQLQVIAQVHAENIASQSPDAAHPVPGLIELSADDVQAVADSGVAPTPDLGTALVDITVGHQLSALQLGKESGSVSAPGTGQLAVRPGPGPCPGTGDVPLPVTDQQASTEPLHPGATVYTGINPNATLSANSAQPGYESAAATFHGCKRWLLTRSQLRRILTRTSLSWIK